MHGFNEFIGVINDFLWAEWFIYIIMATGVVYTFWSVFSQYRSLTHGTAVLRGKYDDKHDPGAISHFQALSAALSATVGLGNIAGVAIAIALGGPGAVFWMWIVGVFGMALKLTEVTLSMLYRDTSNPEEPLGGPMYVVKKGLAHLNPKLAGLGKVLGGIFCVTLLISAVTGGNMFQAWNVADVSQEYFGIPEIASGIILAIVVAMVILGGIKRIGSVAGKLVPFMVLLYIAAGLVVLVANAGLILPTLKLIIHSAFNPTEAAGAFMGGTVAYGLILGMKRALFSSEAGQGSSPIAHSAARTKEPVREGVVAGLEPFIDTIVVCTFTALIILTTGVWDRAAEGELVNTPEIYSSLDTENPNLWQIDDTAVPALRDNKLTLLPNEPWKAGDDLFAYIEGDANGDTANNLSRVFATVVDKEGQLKLEWASIRSESKPKFKDADVYRNWIGATLTAKAFDTVQPNLGKWLVPLAAWLFAISTMISWSYYGEQGIIYLMGKKAVPTYKVIYCLLIIVATMGLFNTTEDIENFSNLGTGVMLWINIPIVIFFGYQAMKAYHDYIDRLKTGKMGADFEAPTIEELLARK